ncbi:MAG: RsmG family class I SAM-dependent methyltransferase, partial [Terriglobales bacterium]
SRLVDVGSGAGFPGLALALGEWDLKTTLVESTGKKAGLLGWMVAELGLTGRVEVRQERLGRAERRRGQPLRADWVTVRAVERMAEVPTWLGAWMAPGAQAAFWVTAPLDARWRAHAGWEWSAFAALPGSRERGIVRAVPRGTSRGSR